MTIPGSNVPTVSGESIVYHPHLAAFIRERLHHIVRLRDGNPVDVHLVDLMPSDPKRFKATDRFQITELQTAFWDVVRDFAEKWEVAKSDLELAENVLTMVARQLDPTPLKAVIGQGEHQQVISAVDYLLGYTRANGEAVEPRLPKGFSLDFAGIKATSDATAKAMVGAHPATIWLLRQSQKREADFRRLETICLRMEAYLKQYDRHIEELKVRFLGAKPSSEGDFPQMEPWSTPLPEVPSAPEKTPPRRWAAPKTPK